MQEDETFKNNFYYEECMAIRRKIRQIDQELLTKEKNKQNQEALTPEINFLLIGPDKAGKSALLKTLSFAFNSTSKVHFQQMELPGTIIKSLIIKRGKNYKIQGLSQVKYTDAKHQIIGFQFESKPLIKNQNPNNRKHRTFQKYSSATQLLDRKIFGCIKVSNAHTSHNQSLLSFLNWNQTSAKSQGKGLCFSQARTVLLVLSLVMKVDFEQLNCLKFFAAELKQKSIKTLVVLTHLDKVKKMPEKERLELIEDRIGFLQNHLNIADRNDYFCIENYASWCQETRFEQFQQLSKDSPLNTSKQRTLNGYQSSNDGQKSQCYEGKNGNFSYSKQLNQLDCFGNQTTTQFSRAGKIRYKKVSEATNKCIQRPNKGQMVFGRKESKEPVQLQKNQKNCLGRLDSQSYQNPIKRTYKYQTYRQKYKEKYKQTEKQSQRQREKQKQDQRMRRKYKQSAPTANEQVNYYALKLLLRIIEEGGKYNREIRTQSSRWFCKG